MANEPCGQRFWYGHVMRSTDNPNRFIALLCWTNTFVNACNVPLLFRGYHHWTQVIKTYYLCAIQDKDDAYEECRTFPEAVLALARMTRSFSLEKRSGDEEGLYSKSDAELRIMKAYGIGMNVLDEKTPYIPMPISLTLVKSRA